jgi:hypothetical protein
LNNISINLLIGNKKAQWIFPQAKLKHLGDRIISNCNYSYQKKQGNPVLILPAFSTVSSRTEMKAIAQVLANHYQVTVLDWLGCNRSFPLQKSQGNLGHGDRYVS